MTSTEPLVAGRYRIVRALGAGGMGRVWLAHDEVLRREVAIKEIVLPFGLPHDEREELRRRTLREARAAARLSHPNVVRIYDVQSGDEQPWIVMEYVHSRSLLQVIEENGALPVEQVAGIGLAVLSALDAANRAGVLHRDVKPSNVLIADDGRVILTDFGSAMIDEGDGAITRTGVILGSPQYIAPERVDTGVSTPEADLWSLGATLYAAVEGRPPYTRATTLRGLIAITTEKPDPVRLAGPLKPVLTGLLQRNPQARMKPAEIEQRLRRLADVETTVHLRHVPQQRPPEAARPNPPQLAVAAPDAAPRAPRAAIDVRPVEAPAHRGAVYATAVRHLRQRWGVGAIAGVAAVIVTLGAVAVAANLVLQSSPPGSRAQLRAAPPSSAAASAALGGPSSPSPPPSPSPSPSLSTPGPFVLPARFLWWKDQTGYQVAWPANWSHQRESSTVMFFCAPGGPPTLRVLVWDDQGDDLTAALVRTETAGGLPDYQRIRLAPVPDALDKAAEWEYTFKDPKAGELHGLEHAFVAGGHKYLVQWRTPMDKWDSARADYDVVMRSFRPAPTT